MREQAKALFSLVIPRVRWTPTTSPMSLQPKDSRHRYLWLSTRPIGGRIFLDLGHGLSGYRAKVTPENGKPRRTSVALSISISRPIRAAESASAVVKILPFPVLTIWELLIQIQSGRLLLMRLAKS